MTFPKITISSSNFLLTPFPYRLNTEYCPVNDGKLIVPIRSVNYLKPIGYRFGNLLLYNIDLLHGLHSRSKTPVILIKYVYYPLRSIFLDIGYEIRKNFRRICIPKARSVFLIYVYKRGDLKRPRKTRNVVFKHLYDIWAQIYTRRPLVLHGSAFYVGKSYVLRFS